MNSKQDKDKKAIKIKSIVWLKDSGQLIRNNVERINLNRNIESKLIMFIRMCII